MAVLLAYEAGLDAVGSVDHDSVAAARETLEAGTLLGLATTVGCEVRVSFAGTPFATRKLNYPECPGKAYIVFHGIPEDKLDKVEAFLRPLREVRVERTRAMTQRASDLFVKAGLPGLDFDRDVVPLTKLSEGGGITERHLCAAAARSLQKAGDPVTLLSERLDLEVPVHLHARLTDDANPHRFYDLVGLLKTTLLDQVFLEPSDEECPPVVATVAFARSVGAIPAYAYLGDVGQSPTGDKKAEHFEDVYLDELVEALEGLGFSALTYMPPRNTLAQLLRLQKLCSRFGLLEISGVDINSSRQSFHCPEVLQPEFAHLNESTWALVAHEKLAALSPEQGFFHPRNPLAGAPLAARIAAYARSGRAMNPRRSSSVPLPQLEKDTL